MGLAGPVPLSLAMTIDRPGPGLETLDRDAFALEDTDQQIGRLGDVAGRNRRVDADVALKRLERFGVDGLPIDGLCE